MTKDAQSIAKPVQKMALLRANLKLEKERRRKERRVRKGGRSN